VRNISLNKDMSGKSPFLVESTHCSRSNYEQMKEEALNIEVQVKMYLSLHSINCEDGKETFPSGF
jgi:hypothetical protein